MLKTVKRHKSRIVSNLKKIRWHFSY